MGWRAWIWCAAASMGVAVGCDGCGGSSGGDIDGPIEDGTDGAASPLCEHPVPPVAAFRDEWRLEVDRPFESGEGAIRSLTIGGLEHAGNFINRGDVLVVHDAPAGRILVEVRRFTQAASPASAHDDFGDLWLWAFRHASAPAPPDQMPAEDDCLAAATWPDGCAIRIYYDGIDQLARAGADLRVHLPPDYVGDLTIVTEDDDEEDRYLNRGDVCIDGLRGSADVTLENGRAAVRVAQDAVPAPTCPADDRAACETWPGGGWAGDCPCIADGHPFAGVVVSTLGTAAANATVDLPAGLWTSLYLVNEGPGQDVADPARHCEATADVPGFTPLDGPGNDFPWQLRGHANLPSDAAVVGAGFRVDLTSSSCAPVEFVEAPEDFACGDVDAEVERRGDLHACSGCLGESACAGFGG